MQKIYIFKGSKKGFDYYIDNITDPVEIFTRLIHQHDTERKRLDMFHHGIPQGENQEKPEQKEGGFEIENLIIYSNHYTFVIEQALFNIKFFLDLYKVKNLYIQNPPSFLEDILKIEYPNIIEYLPFEEYQNLNSNTLNLAKKDFKENIIGQGEAIDRFLNNLYYYSSTKPRKPLIVLFYGSTGIGKTRTVQILSNTLKETLFRKQMSMGYGSEAYTYFYGGKYNEKSFAKDLLERESNIILLDEFDKISSQFYNAFYQFFDEGIYKDHNYSAKLENAIIICTSNFLSESNIKKHLGEAIFSRFDDVIKFKNLDTKSIEVIIDKTIQEELDSLKNEYKNKFSGDVIKTNYFNNYKTKKSLKNAREIKSYVRYILGLEIKKQGHKTTTSSSQNTYKQNRNQPTA